jgi:hypothetical protein
MKSIVIVSRLIVDAGRRAVCSCDSRLNRMLMMTTMTWILIAVEGRLRLGLDECKSLSDSTPP